MTIFIAMFIKPVPVTWGSTHNFLINRLLVLQKKAVRMMTFKDQYPILGGRLNPTNPIFKDLGILKIQDIYKLHITKFIFEWSNKNTPINFQNWFQFNHSIHNYHTTSNVNDVKKPYPGYLI